MATEQSVGLYQRLLLPQRPIDVEQALERALARRILVEITANRSTMVRILPELGRVRIRLHAMFLYAPGEILEQLARYVRLPHDPVANAALDAFIRSERHRVTATKAPRAVRLRQRGVRFDLQEILDRLNREFFDATISARIGWSQGDRSRRRSSILFGSYLRPPGSEVGLIRIHPALDQNWVPREFLELVVFHELLHAVIPTRCEGGRRSYHPPEFRRREREFPDYQEWRAWEKANLTRFLRSYATS